MDKYTKSVLTVIAVFCRKVESGHSNVDLMEARTGIEPMSTDLQSAA